MVGNQGPNFCVGANIMLMLMEAQEENWEELDMMGRVFQNATMSLRYSPKPVVVAPFQMVFGGGCEMVLHADRVRAAAETYIDSSRSALESFPRVAALRRCWFVHRRDSERSRRRRSVSVCEKSIRDDGSGESRDFG